MKQADRRRMELPLVEGAQRLGLSYNRMLRLTLLGTVRGIRLPSGRWLVSEADVSRLAARLPLPQPARRGPVSRPNKK
jgi:predicted site-specific integrase-resolvase